MKYAWVAAYAQRVASKQAMRWLPVLGYSLWIACAGMSLSGCAIKLGPDYDKAIFDGLTKANQDAMTLFASLSNGGLQAKYPSRKPAYDSVIGELDALSVQILARATPPTPALISTLITPSLSAPTVPAISAASSCYTPAPAAAPPAANSPSTAPAQPSPTANAVQCMTFTMTTMRDSDAKRGMPAMLVAGFKMRFAFFMTNALTYEKALDR
jgi:hypothetical protein